MTGAIAPLDDFSVWARSNLLVIILLVLGALLLTRLADWARGRMKVHGDIRPRLGQPTAMARPIPRLASGHQRRALF